MSEAKALNTVFKFEMIDGEKVDMTLTFYSLYQLRPKNKALYEKYSQIMAKGPKDELESCTILYTAYVCANLESIDKLMTEEEFIQRMSYDRIYISEILGSLTRIKKK